MSPFGVRFLNPVWTEVEDRFIAGRVVIKGEAAADALAILRARMGRKPGRHYCGRSAGV